MVMEGRERVELTGEGMKKWSSSKYAELVAANPVLSQIPHGYLGTGDSFCVFQLEPWPGDIIWGGAAKGDADITLARVNLENEKVKWSIRNKDSCGFDYNPETDRILTGYGSGTLAEVDADSGEVIRTWDTWEGVGSIGDVGGPWYDKTEAGYAWVTDWYEHVAGRFDLETGELDPYFGEYGTAGYDFSHLDQPWSISSHGDHSAVEVADNRNNRVLEVDFTASPPTADYAFKVPQPVGVRHQYYPNWSPSRLSANGIINTGSSVNNHYVINGLDYNAKYSQVLGIIPIAANVSTFDLHDPRHVWIPWATSSIRARWDRPFQPEMGRFAWHARATESTTRTIPANGSYTFGQPGNPGIINGLAFEKMFFRVASDQDCTGVIMVPDRQGRLCWVESGYSWVDLASFSVTGGKAEKYTMTAPPAVFNLRVDMGSTAGTVNVQIQGF